MTNKSTLRLLKNYFSVVILIPICRETNLKVRLEGKRGDSSSPDEKRRDPQNDISGGLFRSLTLIPFCIALNLFLFWGCGESLPPRSDPANLFTISISTEYNIVDNFGMLDVFITLKSNYDETLQDVALLDGTLMIDWTADPAVRGNIVPRRTAHIEPSQIVHAQKYDGFTRMLTIDPGDSIVLRYRWNFKTDDSTDLYKQFKYQEDKGCVLVGGCAPPWIQYRRFSANQPFLISAQVKLFGRSATVYAVPFSLVTCVTLPCTNEPKCKAINPDNPCSVFQ